DPASNEPRAQRLSGSGALQWGPLGVPVVTPPISIDEMRVAPDGAGGAFVVWTDQRNDPDLSVVATHLAADGSPAPGWPAAGRVLRPSASCPRWRDVLADGAGGAFILWQEDEDLPVGRGPQPRLVRVHPDGSLYAGFAVTGNPMAPNPDSPSG